MDNIGQYMAKLFALLGGLLTLLFFLNTGQGQRLNNYQDGDLMLGGMFPIHSKSCSCDKSSAKNPSPDESCNQIYPKGLLLAEAMIYAVRLVNRRGILPYDIKLGYHIRDTCNTLNVAVQNTLVFVTERKRTLEKKPEDFQKSQSGKQHDPFSLKGSYPGRKSPSIIAVIGAGNSDLSLAITNILSLYNIPQVAYASSSAVFSDKARYETFLRVLPPDTLQAKAIAQLLDHFKWNYVSLVSSDDHYAGPLRESLRKEIQRLGICLANDVTFSYLPSMSVIRKALLRIKETEKSRVILLFASERSAKVIFQAAESLNLTGRIWIASDSWSNAESLFTQHFSILKGSLGIMFTFTPVTEFVDHLRTRLNKSVEMINQDPWLSSLSIAIRNEQLTSLINNGRNSGSKGTQKHYDLEKFQSVFARVDYVMNSVFILAHVIRDFCLELNVSVSSNQSVKRSKCLDNISPQSLLPLLFNRTLRGFSKNLTVDQNGDPHGSYDFFNLQQSHEGFLHQPKNIKIGNYDSQSKVLKLNDSVFDLGQGKAKVPKSRCSEICLPGFYFVKSPSNQAPCCWECKVCPPGHISNASMATACIECAIDHMPNRNRTRCVYVPLRYLSRTHPWSIFISVCSILCFFLAVFFVWVFIRHRHSPVVRASCFEVSIALLLAIAFGFLLPFVEMSKPSYHKCRASAFLFAVVFAIILSLTLAKINRTVLILKNQMGSGLFHRKFLLSSPVHFVSVGLLSSIQITICIVWFFQDPPQPEISTISLPNFVRFLHCTNHKNLWFLVSSGFLIFLSLICTAIAFLSRNFPENYNHARFISLAMFTFNVVWITFMGAYYGNPQPGIHQVIIHCCAIIFSNLCLLLLTYGPKVYVIFFRPELNNARTFREMNLQHLLGEMDRGRNFSLASVGTSGHHGNVYLIDYDPNEKAVQTIRVFTRDASTQADLDYVRARDHKRRNKNGLVSRIFGRGSRTKSGDESSSNPHKRVWSESDATKTRDTKSIPHSQSSPNISSYAHSQGEKKKRTPRNAKPLLNDLDSSDAFGLDKIEEASAATSSVKRNDGNKILGDSAEFENSTISQCCYIASNDAYEDAGNHNADDEENVDDGVDDDNSPANDKKCDDVFLIIDDPGISTS